MREKNNIDMKKFIPIAIPSVGSHEERAVINVLRSGQLAQSEYVYAFEKAFAQYTGSKYAVATSSGTTALHAALLSLGVGKGDEVITTPFTFIASANAILYTGATPVFVDIDEKTYNLNPTLIERKITKRTKAILTVHLFGLPADMEAINKIARKSNLLLIEDACQAHGAVIKNRKCGAIGDIGCFSFYPTKNMTTGEGGIITTNKKALWEKLKLIREHGMKIRYHHDSIGYNYRMTNIEAAIGIEQLKKLDTFNRKRISNANFYIKELKNIKGIVLPYVPKEYMHVFHQFTIRVTKDFALTREQLVDHLRKEGIGTGIYYPIPVHLQKAYKNIKKSSRFPVAEKAANEVLSLPVYPQLSKKELERIVSVIKNV